MSQKNYEKFEETEIEMLSKEQLDEILDELFPVKDDDSERKKRNIKQMKDDFYICYFMPDIAQFRDTAWGAVNAMSDLITHGKPQRNTKNFEENRWSKIADGHPIMDKFYEAWEIIYDYEKELREQGRENEASVLCQAGPIILKRSTEEVHKNLLKMQEQPRLQLRTIEREQPRQMPRPTIKPRSKEVQNGTIGGVVRTEWGTFFNIAQDPS